MASSTQHDAAPDEQQVRHQLAAIGVPDFGWPDDDYEWVPDSYSTGVSVNEDGTVTVHIMCEDQGWIEVRGVPGIENWLDDRWKDIPDLDAPGETVRVPDAVVKATDRRYFAVADPLDPTRVSYWYRPDKGRKAGTLQPWPPKRNKWGYLVFRTMPEEIQKSQKAPVGTPEHEPYIEYAATFFQGVSTARTRVKQEIDANPEIAAARFARYALRCCCCGKTLTEERSKVYGIGPECRRRMPPQLLADLIERTKEAHSEFILNAVADDSGSQS